MSARDRAIKAQQRTQAFAKEGMRQTLDSPDGRAFIWALYADNIDCEGPGSKGRRMVARDVMRAAQIANWDGVQIMREEWERRAPLVQQPEEGDDE